MKQNLRKRQRVCVFKLHISKVSVTKKEISNPLLASIQALTKFLLILLSMDIIGLSFKLKCKLLPETSESVKEEGELSVFFTLGRGHRQGTELTHVR